MMGGLRLIGSGGLGSQGSLQFAQIATAGIPAKNGNEHHRQHRGDGDQPGGEAEGRYEGEGAESLRNQTAGFAEAGDPSGSPAADAEGIALGRIGQQDRDDSAGADDQKR